MMGWGGWRGLVAVRRLIEANGEAPSSRQDSWWYLRPSPGDSVGFRPGEVESEELIEYLLVAHCRVPAIGGEDSGVEHPVRLDQPSRFLVVECGQGARAIRPVPQPVSPRLVQSSGSLCNRLFLCGRWLGKRERLEAGGGV